MCLWVWVWVWKLVSLLRQASYAGTLRCVCVCVCDDLSVYV